eukprot:gnl/Chilomastix_cuspidata/932.p1 GENE.gnl/Chilomastix_cuspidata/932~~gnl/Chilomastix_cuspidata/932.p1  ORF type:complete len:904 (+),score=235.19 gnl/Chilomastix_cuspidata/932:66-2777(+)
MEEVERALKKSTSRREFKKPQFESHQRYSGVCPTTTIVIPDQYNSHIVEAKQVYLLSRKTHVTTRVFRPHDKSFFSDTVGLNFSSSKRQKMIHVHAGGHDLICSREHLLLVKDPATGEVSWIPAAELTTKHLVATPGLAPTIPPTYPNTPYSHNLYSPLLNKIKRFIASTRDAREQRKIDEYDSLTAPSLQSRLKEFELVGIQTASKNINKFLKGCFDINAHYHGPEGLPIGFGIPTPLQALRRAYLLRLYNEGVLPMFDTPKARTLFRLAGALVGRVEYSLDTAALEEWVQRYFVDFIGFADADGRAQEFVESETITPSSSGADMPLPQLEVRRASRRRSRRWRTAHPNSIPKDATHPLLRCLPPAVHDAPLPTGTLLIDNSSVATEISRDIVGLGFGPAPLAPAQSTNGALFLITLPPVLVLAHLALGFFSNYYVHSERGASLRFEANEAVEPRSVGITVNAPRLQPSGVVTIPSYVLHRLPLTMLSSLAAGLISSRGVRQLDPRKSLQHGLILTPLIIAGGRDLSKGAPPNTSRPRASRLRSQLDYLFSRIGLPVSFSEKVARNFICPVDVAWDHRFSEILDLSTRAAPVVPAAGAPPLGIIALAPVHNSDIVQVHFHNALSAYWVATRIGFPYCPSLRRAAPWLISQTRYPFFLLGNFGGEAGQEIYSDMRENFKLARPENRTSGDVPVAHKAVSTTLNALLQSPRRTSVPDGVIDPLQLLSQTISPPVPALLSLLYSRFINGVPFPFEAELKLRKRPRWATRADRQIDELFGRNMKAAEEEGSYKRLTAALLSLSSLAPVTPSVQEARAADTAEAGASGRVLEIDDVSFSLISADPGPIVSVPASMYARPSPIITWTAVDWVLDVGKRTVCSFKMRPKYEDEYGIVLGGILSRSAPLR